MSIQRPDFWEETQGVLAYLAIGVVELVSGR
jgi:hypothetical protein